MTANLTFRTLHQCWAGIYLICLGGGGGLITVRPCFRKPFKIREPLASDITDCEWKNRRSWAPKKTNNGYIRRLFFKILTPMVIYQDRFSDYFHARFNNELAVLWLGIWFFSIHLKTRSLMVFRIMVRNLKNRPDNRRVSVPASNNWSIMNTLLTHKASNCLNSYWGIIGLAYQGKDIVFRV